MKIEELEPVTEPVTEALVSSLSEAEAGVGKLECVKLPTRLWKLVSTVLAVVGTSEEDVLTELVGHPAMDAPAALLLLLYQYFTGFFDKGGTKTCLSASLELRPSVVSSAHFQGAYVWIRFREVPVRSLRGCHPGEYPNERLSSSLAKKSGRRCRRLIIALSFDKPCELHSLVKFRGYLRLVKNKLSGKPIRTATKLEVRYKPPRRSGNSNYIHLGMCTTDEEAEARKRIAAFNYGRNEGWLELGDSQKFPIPSTPTEQVFSVSAKRAWVKAKVKEVYEDFSRAKGLYESMKSSGRSQPEVANSANVHPGHVEDPLVERSPAHDEVVTEIGPALDQVQNSAFAPQYIQASLNQSNMAVDKELSAEGEEFHVEPTPSNPGWEDEFLNILRGNNSLPCEEFPEIIQDGSGVAPASNRADLSIWPDEGAPPSFQISEFLMSPILISEEGSETMETIQAIATPSVINLSPTNCTTELLAKVISLQEQKIQEQGRKIFELERKVERLRGNSKY